MENKPRKAWVAGLLSFFTIGLGHIYAGEVKKGIILYFCQGLILAILLPLLIVKPNIYALLFALILGLVYFLYSLIDAIKTAKSNSVSYFLKKFNKWYIYLGCWVLASFVVQPIVETFTKNNTIKAYKIPSGAMIPTLLVGDHILVNRFIYKANKPERSDIIVFEYPEDPSKDFIKRLVAIEGDIVEIKNKKLFVNGILQNENFVIHKENNIFTASQNPRDNFGPITVPNNSLFFMGDNRDNSFDSRFWGFVDKSKIKGKAVSLYWSWDEENFRVRWDRIGKEIK